jgi:SAM-dependent methyltransferase
MRVLDAGCGTGKATGILFEMVQPGGNALGIDFSEKRISYAREKYGRLGLDFQLHDLTGPLENIGEFDFIWVRFLLEYFLKESEDIVRQLSECLAPGGRLCLLDLDHNCLSHYGIAQHTEEFFFRVMKKISAEQNFDPYCGRKLYSFLYDLGLADIRVDIVPHHLIYGDIRDVDVFNWIKKIEVSAGKVRSAYSDYPGGFDGFISEFKKFFLDPRRFTYTPLIMCTGIKP